MKLDIKNIIIKMVVVLKSFTVTYPTIFEAENGISKKDKLPIKVEKNK